MRSSEAVDLSCFAQEHISGKGVFVKRASRIHFLHSHPLHLTPAFNIRLPLSSFP